MLMSKQKLSIQIRQVNRIQINLIVNTTIWGEGRGTMKMCLKLCRQSVLRSSQPIPPAPTRRARVDEKSILHWERRDSNVCCCGNFAKSTFGSWWDSRKLGCFSLSSAWVILRQSRHLHF